MPPEHPSCSDGAPEHAPEPPQDAERPMVRRADAEAPELPLQAAESPRAHDSEPDTEADPAALPEAP